MSTQSDTQRKGSRAVYWLLLLPYLALLFPGFYAKAEPVLFGFPFFYWYQFLWVILSAVITFVVYKVAR